MIYLYIQSTSDFNYDFYIQLTFKQIFLLVLGALSNYSYKVMKLLHNMPKASNLLFAAYHQYYKEKIISNLTRTIVCVTNYICFLCNWINLLIAFYLADNNGLCATKPGLVTKKEKLPKTFIHLSNLF